MRQRVEDAVRVMLAKQFIDDARARCDASLDNLERARERCQASREYLMRTIATLEAAIRIQAMRRR